MVRFRWSGQKIHVRPFGVWVLVYHTTSNPQSVTLLLTQEKFLNPGNYSQPKVILSRVSQNLGITLPQCRLVPLRKGTNMSLSTIEAGQHSHKPMRLPDQTHFSSHPGHSNELTICLTILPHASLTHKGKQMGTSSHM